MAPERKTQFYPGKNLKGRGGTPRRFHVSTSFPLLLDIERYSRRARRVGEARDNVGRNRLSFDRSRLLRIGSHPNTLFKAIERELTASQDSVTHCKAASSPFSNLTLDNDLVVEATGNHESRSHFDHGHTDYAVFFAHRRGRQPGALEQPTGAGVKDDEVLGVKHDPRRIALPPFDTQSAAID
jgi:hypothetical protein